MTQDMSSNNLGRSHSIHDAQTMRREEVPSLARRSVNNPRGRFAVRENVQKGKAVGDQHHERFHNTSMSREGNTHTEHMHIKEPPPTRWISTPPPWLKHPSKEAVDSTRALRHVKSSRHAGVEHRHGFASGINAEGWNEGLHGHHQRSSQRPEASRVVSSKISDSGHEHRFASGLSPQSASLTAQTHHAESSPGLHPERHTQSRHVEEKYSRGASTQSQIDKFRARYEEYSRGPSETKNTHRSHKDLETSSHDSRLEQEEYRQATLRAEEELSELLKGVHELQGLAPSGESTTMEASPELLRPRHMLFKTHDSKGNHSHVSNTDVNHEDSFRFIGGSSGTKLHRPTPLAPPNHNCSWKDRYLSLTAEIRLLKAELAARVSLGGAEDLKQAGNTGFDDDLGLQGVTIVMHLKGKDDVVIDTDLTQEADQSEGSVGH
ncbi:hypothetical protein F4778DRAFT_725157 [Xylariomycetidae sp. FL2044]|nr:hypothetical protein F4778DRAFT_725157 [Xylariomycetidae sp. FL2044]